MSFGAELFDSNKPYPSLVNFTNNVCGIYKNQKEAFIGLLEDFFSKKAYADIGFPIPPPLAERFHLEAATLWAVAKDVHLKGRKVRMRQLLANIAKVAGISLEQAKLSKPFYQIVVSEGDNPRAYWGWIEGSYVLDSEMLKTKLRSGTLYFNSQELKPEVLLGLQRMVAYRDFLKTPEGSFDINYEMIFDLAIFAHVWGISSLGKLVADLAQKIGLEKPSPKEKKEIESIKERYDKQLLDKALAAPGDRNERSNYYILSTKTRLDEVKEVTASIKLTRFDEAEDGGAWFSKSDPFGSMLLFTGRCCALSTSEQLRFFSTVRFFFSGAFNAKSYLIPPALKARFSEIVLPFLLKTMQLEEAKRHQLLASVQRVTKEAFPNLPARDQLRLIHNHYGPAQMPMRVEFGWVASPVANPAVLEIQSEAPLFVEENQELKSPVEIVGRLLAGLEYEIPAWIEQANTAIQKMGHPIEIKTLLARSLHRERVRNFVRANMRNSFTPDVKQLNQEQVYQLFLFGLEINPNSFKSRIEDILDKSEHRAVLFARVEASATAEQQQALQEYYRDRFLARVPYKERGPYNRKPQETFVKNTLESFKNYPSKYAEKAQREKEILSEKKQRDLIDEDFRTIHTYLLSPEAVDTAQKGGLDAARQLLVKGIEEVHPELIVGTIFERFVAEFFPNHVEQKNNFLKTLEALLEASSAKSYPSSGAIENFVRQHPLSDEEIVQAWEILTGDRCKTWLRAHAKDVDQQSIRYYCKDGYHADALAVALPFRKALAKAAGAEGAVHAKECAFLNAYVPTAEERDVIPSALTLMKERNIDAAEVAWLASFLKKDEGRALFATEQQAKVYPRLLHLLERIPLSKAFATTFMTTFEKEIGTAYGDYLKYSSGILQHCVQTVHLCEGKASRDLFRLGIPNGSLWNFFWIEAVGLVENRVINTWLNLNGEEFMSRALLDSFKEADRELPLNRQMYDFLKTLKAKNTDQKLLDFLNSAILDTIRSRITIWEDLDTEAGKTKVLEELQRSAWLYDLTRGKANQGYYFLIDPQLGGKLTEGYFPQAVEYLKQVICELPGKKEATFETREEGPQEQCIVS